MKKILFWITIGVIALGLVDILWYVKNDTATFIKDWIVTILVFLIVIGINKLRNK